MNEEVIQLQFIYPVAEFSKKFLDSVSIPINTCIDTDGSLYVVSSDDDMLNTFVIPSYCVIQDLQDDHETMRDEQYNYTLAYSYLEMMSKQLNEEDVVFIRVEKTKKEGFNNG